MEIVTINDNNLQPVMSVKTACSVTDDYADVFDNKLGKLPGKLTFKSILTFVLLSPLRGESLSP